MMSLRHELELKEQNVRRLLIEDDEFAVDKHYPGHPWTIVKLVLLGQWAHVYTKILSKHWRSGIRYVDLLAGSGTTKVQETNDVIKGSPFVVKEYAFKPFDDYVLVERNEERYNALCCNSKQIGKISNPMRGDCNNLIDEIFIDQSCHNLVFIDMEGFDVYWKGMLKIIKSQSDIIINFPTSCYERTKALANQQVLDKFFGDHTWADRATDREEFLKLYMEKLARSFWGQRKKQPYVDSIRVGNTTYFYDLILLCKNGGYVNVWGDYMKRKWNWQNPKHMKTLLNHLKGRVTRLDDF